MKKNNPDLLLAREGSGYVCMYVCILARLGVSERSVYKNKAKTAWICPVTQLSSNKTAFLLAMQT
jgi:hypothetical protein